MRPSSSTKRCDGGAEALDRVLDHVAGPASGPRREARLAHREGAGLERRVGRQLVAQDARGRPHVVRDARQPLERGGRGGERERLHLAPHRHLRVGLRLVDGGEAGDRDVEARGVGRRGRRPRSRPRSATARGGSRAAPAPPRTPTTRSPRSRREGTARTGAAARRGRAAAPPARRRGPAASSPRARVFTSSSVVSVKRVQKKLSTAFSTSACS